MTEISLTKYFDEFSISLMARIMLMSDALESVRIFQDWLRSGWTK